MKSKVSRTHTRSQSSNPRGDRSGLGLREGRGGAARSYEKLLHVVSADFKEFGVSFRGDRELLESKQGPWDGTKHVSQQVYKGLLRREYDGTLHRLRSLINIK